MAQSTISNLNGDSVGFTEGGSAALIDSGSDASVTDGDASGYDGGDITISVLSASANEDLSIREGSGVTLSAGMTNGSTVTIGGLIIGAIGTTGQDGASLVVNFNANTTEAAIGTLIQNITYANDADYLSGTRTVRTVITDDGAAVSSNNDVTVTLTDVNDPPTLTAMGANPAFTEEGSAVSAYSGTTISTIEDGQNIIELKFTVTNVSNGANEVLSIDGSDVALTDGNSVTTTTNSMTADVSVTVTTATVTISKALGISNALMQTLVNGITYRNGDDDPETSNRVITLTSIKDDGGVANSGIDTSVLSVASTVSITAVNDAPTLTATTEDPTFTEDGSAAIPFSATDISTIEDGQNITELKFTVTNVNNGSDEILSIDGSDVALTDGTSVTTATNSMTASVSVAATTATVTVSKVGGISSALMKVLVNEITYRNENDTPNTSNRVVTLTSIKDDGGIANSGSDTSVLSVASTITVVAANDNPVLDNTKSPALAGIMEGLGSPSGGSTDNSTLVTAIIDNGGALDNYSDPESDSPGIAVVAVNANGSLWYSLNDGTSWSELTGTVSATSALVLFADATTRLYFEPGADVSGNLSDAITMKAWDRTSGDANGTTAVNTTTGTSFSTITDDVSVAITDVNDPPELTATANDPNFTEGGGAVDLFSGVSLTTPEAGQAFLKLNLHVYNVYNGAQEILKIDGSDISLDVGDTVTTTTNSLQVWVSNHDTTGIVKDITIEDTSGAAYSQAAAEALIENLTYNNTSTSPNESDRKVVIYFAKDNGGTSNGGVDSTFNMDSTTVSVTAINEAPVLDNTESPEFNGVPENVGDPVNGEVIYSTLVSNLIGKNDGFGNENDIDNYSDNDNDLPGLAVIAINAQGTLWYSLDNGATWNLSGAVNETGALVLKADDDTRLYYKPDNGVSGAVADAIEIKAWDRTSGDANGTSGVNTTVGSSFSAATDVVSINIADINYPPTISTTALDPVFTEGDGAKDLFSTVDVSTPENGQLLTELRVEITNVINSSDEVMSIDGENFQLVDGNSITTAANSYQVSSELEGNTLKLVLLKAAGATEADIENLIDGFSYVNNSRNPTDLSRVVSLTFLKDDGGSVNGSDSSSFAINSTITFKPVNEPPVINNLNLDVSHVVAGGAAINIDFNSDASVTDADSYDFDGGNILITQTAGTANGNWSFDGTTIKSGADGVIAASEIVYYSGSEIGTVDAVNDGQGGNTLEIDLDGSATPASIAVLIKNLLFEVPADYTDRVFSLTLADGDSTANGGNDEVDVSFTVSVTQIAPVVTNLDGDRVKYAQGSGGIILDDGNDASVTDGDSPNFNAGNLTATITSGLQASEDQLNIDVTGDITLSDAMNIGSIVSVAGVAVGTITSTGRSGHGMVVTFDNDNATPVRITSLLKALAYNNSSANPNVSDRTISISVKDGNVAGSATSNISSVTVQLNNEPTTTGLSDVTAPENSPNTNIDLTLSFDDVEDGSDGLVYTIDNISNAVIFSSVSIIQHTLVLDYLNDTNGTSDIRIKATDTGGLNVVSTFNVVLGTGTPPPPDDDDPVVEVNTGADIPEGGSFTLSTQMLSAQDRNGSTDGLVYNITGQPIHGSLVVSRNLFKRSSVETLSFTQSDLESGKVNYIHNGDEAASDTIKFTVTDQYGDTSAEFLFVILFENKNDAPVIEEISAVQMREDEPYTILISDWYDNITDPDNADSTLSIMLSCSDENITLTKLEGNSYSVESALNFYGNSELDIIVSDTEYSDSAKIPLIISPVNDLPVIDNIPEEITITQGSINNIEFKNSFHDIETPDSLLTIVFEFSCDSVYANYKSSECLLTMLPTGTFIGSMNLTVIVTDESGGMTEAVLTANIIEDVTGIFDDDLPTEFALYQNYPNPFNPSTTISYSIPAGTWHAMSVQLRIYDILGNEVATLVNEKQSPGRYNVTWNACNRASGIYFSVFQAGKFREVKKMILMK